MVGLLILLLLDPGQHLAETLVLDRRARCFALLGVQQYPVPSSRGTVQNQSNIMTRYFRLMQIEAGIYVEVVKLETGKKTVRKRAKYGLHPLRHFCASLWIEANYSAKRVQTYMGHASIVQTYDTYGYLFDLRDNDKEALKRIESRVMSGVDEPNRSVA